jgi:hypothetical protein
MMPGHCQPQPQQDRDHSPPAGRDVPERTCWLAILVCSIPAKQIGQKHSRIFVSVNTAGTKIYKSSQMKIICAIANDFRSKAVKFISRF